MYFLERLRYLLFWITDFINKGHVRKHYLEIKYLINNTDADKARETHNKCLNNILRHAVSTTEFYKRFDDYSGLEEFPVINKSIIRNDLDNFFSNKFNKESLLPFVTSGSTGTPFKIYQDKNKKSRNYADTIFFAQRAGYEIGHRLIYLKIWVARKMSSKLSYWLQNIVPVDVTKLTDLEIKALLNKLENDRSDFGILGYASAIELICKYLDHKKSNQIKARIRSIISISEGMSDYTKSKMTEFFGVMAVSRYSNLENGIIAQQEINGLKRFLINSASYHVEILDMNKDEKVKNGELGRIVITDLFNYAMPLIRYDTGDIGSIETDEENPSRKYFSVIEGRKLDLIYDTKGELISSYIMYKNMWQYTEIVQYQLVQENLKQYIFKINTQIPFLRETQLVEEFKSFLGEDADFRIEYVTEIPLLASGKRRIIVNNYYK